MWCVPTEKPLPTCWSLTRWWNASNTRCTFHIATAVDFDCGGHHMISSTQHFHDTGSPSLKGAYLHGECGSGEGALQADRQPGDSHRWTGALEPQTGQAASPGQHEEHRQRRHRQVREASTLHLLPYKEKYLHVLHNVANQEVISAEQEVAHSRRRQSDLVVRSVPIMIYFKKPVTLYFCSLNVWVFFNYYYYFGFFRILSRIKAA